jgi:hypothetical protein
MYLQTLELSFLGNPETPIFFQWIFLFYFSTFQELELCLYVQCRHFKCFSDFYLNAYYYFLSLNSFQLIFYTIVLLSVFSELAVALTTLEPIQQVTSSFSILMLMFNLVIVH